MQSRYIIFADDDSDDLELITGFFKQNCKDVKVLEFKDGKEVLQFLADFCTGNNLPALIVLDNNMPRMNGKEALVAIRSNEAYKNVPVLIYSTSVNEADKMFCSRYHASLTGKPNTVQEVNAIAKILVDFCHQNA